MKMRGKCNPWLPFDLIFQRHFPTQRDGLKLHDKDNWTQNTLTLQIASSCVRVVSPWSFLNPLVFDVNAKHRESSQSILHLSLQMNHAITFEDKQVPLRRIKAMLSTMHYCVGGLCSVRQSYVYSESLGWKSSLQLQPQNNSSLAFLPWRSHR